MERATPSRNTSKKAILGSYGEHNSAEPLEHAKPSITGLMSFNPARTESTLEGTPAEIRPN